MGRKLIQILLSSIAALTFSTSVHAEDSWRDWEKVGETGDGVRQAFDNLHKKEKVAVKNAEEKVSNEKEQFKNLEGIVTVQSIERKPMLNFGESVDIEGVKTNFTLRLENNTYTLSFPQSSEEIKGRGSKNINLKGTHYRVFWGPVHSVPGYSFSPLSGKTVINIAVVRPFIANISDYENLVTGKLDGKLIEKAKAKYPNVSNFDMEKLRGAFIRSTDKKFPSYAGEFKSLKLERLKLEERKKHISNNKEIYRAHLQTILDYTNETDFFLGKMFFSTLEPFYDNNPTFKNESYFKTKAHFKEIKVTSEHLKIFSSRGEEFSKYFIFREITSDPKLYHSLSVILKEDQSFKETNLLIRKYEKGNPSWKNMYLKVKKKLRAP